MFLYVNVWNTKNLQQSFLIKCGGYRQKKVKTISRFYLKALKRDVVGGAVKETLGMPQTNPMIQAKGS